MTNIAYPTHITNTHEHIYIQHMLPIYSHEHIYIQHISMNTYPTNITRNDLKLNIDFPKNYLITKIFSRSSSFLPTCITKTLRKREWVRSRNVAFHLMKCNAVGAST